MNKINWVNHIDKTDKKKIEEYLSQIEQGKVQSHSSGGFSKVYFLDNYAIKLYIGMDFLDDETHIMYEDIEIEVNSEENILTDLQHTNYYPTLYGYNDYYVIMEKVEGLTVEDYYFMNGHLPNHLEETLKRLFISIINIGWVPYDIRLNDIFYLSNNKFKLIDVNLYQRKDLYKHILLEEGIENFVNKYIQQIFKHELKYLDDIREYSDIL